jgi:excisionase family DNA binding protein
VSRALVRRSRAAADSALARRVPLEEPAQPVMPAPGDSARVFAWLIEQAAAQRLPQYLTIREAAKYVGLREGFIYGLIEAGVLRAANDGRVKVRRFDLDNLAPEDLVPGRKS